MSIIALHVCVSWLHRHCLVWSLCRSGHAKRFVSFLWLSSRGDGESFWPQEPSLFEELINCVILRHDSAKKKNETSPALLHLVDAEKGQANCELKEVVRALSLLPIAYNIYRQLLSWTLSRRKHFFFLNEVACSDQSQTLVYAMCRYYTRLVASTQI